jgi:hypothetical protein
MLLETDGFRGPSLNKIKGNQGEISFLSPLNRGLNSSHFNPDSGLLKRFQHHSDQSASNPDLNAFVKCDLEVDLGLGLFYFSKNFN